MEVRVHGDAGEYWRLARPIFAADPMRHTHGLTVGRQLAEAPIERDDPPVLLTLWDRGAVVGAAFRAQPWPLGVSAVPAGRGVELTARTLLGIEPDLKSVAGPRDAAERFAEVWAKLTGGTVREVHALRLYRLGTLAAPEVAGHGRLATDADLTQLIDWHQAFDREVFGRSRGRPEVRLSRSIALGNAHLVWEVAGRVVSYAVATAPVDRMSRIAPVYTPPELRGRGYGAAAAAAASRWACDAGAEYVLLFADVANPVSTGIYLRIGYRPVYDQTELAFDH